MTSTSEVIYYLSYIVTTIYFVTLGCIMLTRRGNLISMHGELLAKQRMTRTVGIFMFFWAFGWLIYLPPMLYGCDNSHPIYKVCFLVTMTLCTPMLFMVMDAIVQKQINNQRWMKIIGTPFLLLTLWYVFTPSGYDDLLPIHIAGALNIVCAVSLLTRHIKEYRIYISRIKSEYSEITDLEILWSWSCFAGFAVQSVIFALYQLYWTFPLEIIYMILSIVNASYLCYCTCRQKPLDYDIVEESIPDVVPEPDNKKKAFYTTIEQKLETLCEEKLLFLEPDLTRETLCLRLSIGKTYLSMYFRERGITFYQYINTLRVHHAVKLILDNPNMPIREISELSGFRSQTTFRKVFHEVMGCLPSDMKARK